MQRRQEILFHLTHSFFVQKLKVERQQKFKFKFEFLDNSSVIKLWHVAKFPILNLRKIFYLYFS
jgi:hypothetical protein